MTYPYSVKTPSSEDKARRISDASTAEDLDKATKNEFREGIRSSGQRRLDELGVEIAFDLDDPRVVQFIAEESSNQIVGINNRTKKLVRATLREGFENGESINKLARRIRGVYADAQGRRSLVIARTESVRALNSGQVAATAQAGFEGKQWLSTQDPKVRDTHAIGTGMDGQIVGVNGDFVSPSGAVGPFPGAMSTAAESVNCRCTTLSIAKVPQESSGDEVVWPFNLRTEERREQVWRAAERIRLPIQRQLRRAFQRGFADQERAVLQALREIERLAALALQYERTEPMTDKNQLQVFTGRRLWTGERSARKLLTESPDELEGVLLLHPRIADSIEKQGDEDSRVRRFRISTETKDRHGDVIRSKGIQLKNFRKNPVVLFAHNAHEPPIGKSPKMEKGDGFLDADVDFFEREVFEFADTIFRIVDVGGLKAASVGFMPLDFESLEEDSDQRFPGIDFKKIDLLEFSIVPIPANPEAVARALSDGAAMQPYLKWLDEVQDNWADVEELFAGLGATADDVMAVRRAADGDKTAVQTKPFADGGVIKLKDAPLVGDRRDACISLTAEMQDRLARTNLAKIAENTPGIVPAPKDTDDPLSSGSEELEDLGTDPEELRWMDVEPLKNHPDLFVYDHEEGRLMAWLEDDLLVDAKYVELIRVSRGEEEEQAYDAVIVRSSGDFIYTDEEAKQGGFAIQTVAGRKSKWKSKDAFLAWSKDHSFLTDKVDTTRNFWRLLQWDPDDFERLHTISINPNDVEVNSPDCKVQAVGGPLKQVEDTEEEISTEDGKNLYDTLRDISLGYRASLIVEGSYGEELWDMALDRLIRSRSFFRIVEGEAVDLGEDQPENMETLEDERPVFARVIMDRRSEDSLGRARVLATDDVKDIRGLVEVMARHVADINGDPDQIVIVGRAVGRLDDEEVYEDCVAFRWISTDEVVRISLGEEFSDPIAQVCEMSNAIHGASRALSSADEYRLHHVVQLLTEVLERSKEQEAPEPETAEDVIAALVEEPGESEEDGESDGDLGDVDFSQVDAEELRDILGDDIRKQVSEIVRDSARGKVQKETGTID